jgi:hypothetical protein
VKNHEIIGDLGRMEDRSENRRVALKYRKTSLESKKTIKIYLTEK